MADLSVIKLPNGSSYNLKDSQALATAIFSGHELTLTKRGTGTQVVDLGEFDTINITDANVGNLVVTGAGRFTNGLYGNLTGNASTATTASALSVGSAITTATNLDAFLEASRIKATTISTGVTYSGGTLSANDGEVISIGYSSTTYGNQIFFDPDTDKISVRRKASSWQPWIDLIHTGNYTTYTVKKDGTGATGTWGISISGNAATATSATNSTNATNATNAVNATNATNDASGNNIKANYAASFSISGHTITLKNKNGESLGTVTVPDNDANTWRAIQVNGTQILASNVSTALNLKAGTNVSISNSSGTVTIAATDTKYNVVSKTENGLVPQLPNETTTTKYLRQDGSWAVPPDNNTHNTAYIYAGASDGSANAATTTGNTYLILKDGSSVSSRIKLATGANMSIVSDANGNVTFTPTGLVSKSDELLTTNPFAPDELKGPYISKIDDALYAADKRWNVSATNINGSVSTLFDGSYETTINVSGGNTAVITIDFSTESDGFFPGYPYGYFLISFYYTTKPASVSGRVYCNYSAHGVGWHNINFSRIGNNDSAITYKGYQGYYQISKVEITIVGDTTNSYGYTGVSEIELHLDRPDSRRNPFLSKYQAETLYYDLTAPNFIGNLSGNATTATTAGSFSSAQSITLTGDVTGSASSQAGWSIATTLKNSGVTADSYGPSANASPAHGGTFSVPYITVDAKGRITSASTKTITLPSSGNTDTKVTQTAVTASSYTNWRPLVFGASNSSTEGFSPSTVTDGTYTTSVFSVKPSTGTIRATTFKGALSGNATTATKATQDEDGNNIKANYAASISISGRTITLKNKNGEQLGDTIDIPSDNTNTWRPIKLDGTEILGTATSTNALNLKAGTNISITNSSGTVTIATAITNNVTGSGTSGYLAKFNGTNTITSGPQLVSTTANKFLRDDGNWQPSVAAGTGISVSGTTVNHSNSVTAGTAGTSSATSGPTIAVPYVTYDAQGHITAVGTHTHTVNGALSVTSLNASSYVGVNSGSSGTAGGLALYGTTPTDYGIAMRNVSNGSAHGYVNGDWATYFYMKGTSAANSLTRGWIFKNVTNGNVASISGAGNAVFNGSVTIGGNTGNTSGCRMEYDATLNCVNWIFN